MLRKNQSGYGAIEAVLIVVVVGIIGGVGWYVWKSQNETKDTLDNLSSAQNDPQKAEKKAEPAVDPTKDWIVFKSDKGKFTLKHPPSWVTAKDLDYCGGRALLVGADEKSVGVCASENGGQMVIQSMDGDNTSNYQLKNGFVNVKSSTININGMDGTKSIGEAKGQQDGEGIPGLPDGTKVVSYSFFSKGITYTAMYTQLASYPNVLSDFELLVTKTLQFN